MKTLPFLFFISYLVIHTPLLNAQNKKWFTTFEIGGEGGMTFDYLTVRDEQNNMERAKFLIGGLGGPRLRAYLNSNFFIETSFLFKENVFGYHFIQEDKYANSSTNASEIFMIALRTGYEWKLSEKIFFNVSGGIVPTFITLHSSSSGYGTRYPGNIYSSYQMKDEYKKLYVAIQPGLSFSHLILRKIKFSYGINYYHGLADAETYDVSYSINNGPTYNAGIANKGSFINYNLGLGYRFE